jgi:uracil-DNA glycosylase family 4
MYGLTTMMFERCSSCQSTYCPIPTDGPLDSEVLVYGERPGQQEEFAARKARDRGYFNPEGQNCFIGDAGSEFNDNYLSLGGLRRDNVRVGNTVLCGAEGNKHPTDKQAKECAAFHIHKDIQETPSLKLVVLMGGVAASLVDGLDLEAEHGIPRWVEDWYGYTGWLVAQYHPAAGIHNTSYMIPLLADWEALGRWLKTGDWQWPLEAYDQKEFRLAENEEEVKEYFSQCER